MKIEHTTYDACHKVSAKRPTATENIRSFFQKDSRKEYHVEGDGKRARFDVPNDASRRLEQRIPSSSDGKQRLAQEEGIVKCQRQEQKHAKRREQEQAGESTRVPLYGWTATRTAGKSCCRVADDGKDVKKLTKGDNRPVQSKFGGHVTLEPFPHTPNKPPELQPTRYNPVARSTPTSRPRLNPKSTPRTAHKEAQSLFAPLNTSADLLDSKRREFKSAFQKGTQRFRIPTHVSKKRRQGSDSDESLFCSGEPASTSKDHFLSNTESATGQWPPRVQSKNLCRLCHVQNPAGIRGICIQCENTYCIAQHDDFDNFYAIEPTPHLEGHNPASAASVVMERNAKVLHSPSVLPPRANELRRLKVHNVAARKPTFVATSIKHQRSNRAFVGRFEPARKKAIPRSVHWPAGEILDVYERSKNEASVRPPLKFGEYGSSICSAAAPPRVQRSSSPRSSEEDHAMQLTRRENPSGKAEPTNRDDNPYAFYGPLLRDHGATSPNCGKSTERYNDL